MDSFYEKFFNSNSAKIIAGLMGRISKKNLPKPIVDLFIKTYSFGFGISMDEVFVPEGGFNTFEEFFTRHLKEGARPLCRDLDAFVSPCDGTILDFGQIDKKSKDTFNIKHQKYSFFELTNNPSLMEKYAGGGYLVIYLHPRDYHRVHSPVHGNIKNIRHIQGAVFPVNGLSEKRVDKLYQKNERVVFEIDTRSKGKICLTMVAAFGVGNIKHINQEKNTDCNGDTKSGSIKIMPGDEIGAFSLGSTVLILWSKDAVLLDSNTICGYVKMGSRLGVLK